MTSQLAEQIRKSGIVNSPVGDPEKGVGFRIDPAHPITQRTDTQPISKAEATFRSVMMGLVATAPITDRQSLNQAEAILESGKAALHERAVSTFSATLEQTANSIPAEYMLEQVTRAVQEYEQKHDPAWVDTPEETVRRAAEARGYNPAEITGGRSEILLRDLEKLKLAMEEGKNVTSFEILQTFIFQTLGRYETTDGRIIAVWQDGEREYSSNQDAWEDIFTTQTLRNVMNETMATLAGETPSLNFFSKISDPAAPATGTEDPTTSPELDPTNPPTPTDELPPPSPTPSIEPTPSVFNPNQVIDTSLVDGQEQVVRYGGHGNIYVYDVVSGTIIAPPGVNLSEADRLSLTSTAQTQVTELKRRNEKFDYVAVQTNGVAGDGNRNAATAFVKIGAEWAIQWPSAQIAGKNALSTSPSDWNFIAPVTSKDITYTDILLPANAKPESVLVRWVGENQIVEVTGTDGSQWVMNWQTGEWVSMIDRPTNYEQMKADLFDYATVYHRNVEPGQQSLFADPEAIIGRLEEKTGTGKDGTPFKALVDPETNTILFLKTQNQETGEWEWKNASVGNLREKLGLFFTITNAEVSDFREQQKILEMMCGNECEIGIAGEMQMNMVFQEFNAEEWLRVLENWESIQADFSERKVPENYPYYWRDIDSLMSEYTRMANNAGVEVKFKSGLMLWPTFDNLTSGGTTKIIHDLNLPQEDNLKFLEFMVKSRVLNYPQIQSWNVSDEVIAGESANDPNYAVWQKITGLTSPELIAQIATWIKEVNPGAQTIMNEHGVFNYNNAWTRPIHTETLRTLEELSAMNAPLDAFMDQQNLGIRIGIDPIKMGADIRKIQNLGFDIAGGEIMISVNPSMTIDGNPNLINPPKGNTPEEKQANMFRELIQVYFQNGVTHIGFGGFEDNTAWTNGAGQPDANPTLFDHEYKPKLAYYYIMQLLSEMIIADMN